MLIKGLVCLDMMIKMLIQDALWCFFKKEIWSCYLKTPNKVTLVNTLTTKDNTVYFQSW